MATTLIPAVSVLVVDGAEFTRTLVRDILRRGGLRRVLEAADGAAAIEMLADARPDVMILDWDVGVIGAPEVVRMTRTASMSANPRLPIIATIACPVRSTIDAALAAGVSEIVAKPFSARILWSRLGEAVLGCRSFAEENGMLRPAARRA
jgi:CheY-like chemotaxis protein